MGTAATVALTHSLLRSESPPPRAMVLEAPFTCIRDLVLHFTNSIGVTAVAAGVIDFFFKAAYKNKVQDIVML
jgi:hypothetical protein